ncbi:carboxylating nicotinate-nucleotide diphosphorylase [Opitutus sp. ER46]|uniref:carboxylating nicotinate-nucleotide diphosphorylase n=1 Tax=Opitutus sp. ER46 TaxID=2161864 RepID=UPI000D3202DB|nr:carboxylating nicotinate-nucleotide diphosphorylase [Opitutus sp. ER46]PTX98602.1 carboxylating nicotinate-nucleotide diphosphorylase [Opitutus sp. ER46]
MITARTDHLIDLALEEDAGLGDVTSRAIFNAQHRSRAFIEAAQDLVLCGVAVAARVFERVDPALKVTLLARDGDRLACGNRVLQVAGPTASLLTAERTALNFLQRLSGVATQSGRFAAAIAGTGVRIVDTRKTTPGWRALEKYAVRCGGCFNHRSSLGEHVLIKENHIAAAGSLTRAVQLTRAAAPHLAKIEVEAKSLPEVKEALRAKADAILLDNMKPAQVREAVALIAGAAVVEVSGGVRFDTLRDYALPGVDVISIGALTHSAPAADLSLTLVGATDSKAGPPAARKRRRENRP